VPVAREDPLFILTACAATLFAAIQVLTSAPPTPLRGTQKEFEAIIAVVIGGTLLTGGYGSAIGAMFGALIFGIVQMGIFYTGIDTDWFKAVHGNHAADRRPVQQLCHPQESVGAAEAMAP
jgi:simple sugar transport system permease protein